MPTAPPFSDLIASARRSAVHLEQRDTYTPDDPVFHRWLAGGEVDYATEAAPGWFDVVRETVSRGVVMRRVRVVSEPLADYTRYEYASAGPLNVAAGEDVRWLPRNRTLDMCLPGLDFWVFDDHTVRAHHFSGGGEMLRDEVVTDPDIVRHCLTAFEAAWERATPHEKYRPS